VTVYEIMFDRCRGVTLFLLLVMAGAVLPISPAHAQEPGDSVAAPDSSSVSPFAAPVPSLPVFAVLGVGFGNRSDACVLCESPRDNRSFTAYLGVGRPLGHGLGVGLDVSFWRRTRPGTPGIPDGEGVPTPTSLANMLGNLSVSFSYRYWQTFIRAGFGAAFGSQDLEMELADGSMGIHTAKGIGIGYSAGAGFTIPLASMVALAFYANWNVGHYDMVSPQGLQERSARHQYFEVGVGVAAR
jgi:hypothetical protein